MTFETDRDGMTVAEYAAWPAPECAKRVVPRDVGWYRAARDLRRGPGTRAFPTMFLNRAEAQLS